MDGYKKLMIAVLTLQVKDYMSIVKAKSRQAECYIFDDSKENQGYIFSFDSICKYIELDPTKFRAKLKSLKAEKGIYSLKLNNS